MIETDTAPLTVRPYRVGDERAIVALFNRVFRRQITERHYRWKLLHHAWAPDCGNVWVAEADGHIVGHYAGTPMRLRMGGRDRLALHGCDVMTAPEWRRRGVLTRLGEAATRAWREAGVALLTGLHYGGWGSRRHALGWRELFPAIWLGRTLRPGALLAGRARLPRAAGSALDAAARVLRPRRARGPEGTGSVAVETLAAPGEECDLLWRMLSPCFETLVVRDAAWLRYRYLDAPGHAYMMLLARRAGRPAGYAVWRATFGSGVTRGWLADLFAAPEDDAVRHALVRAVLEACERAGAAWLRTLVPPSNPVYDAVRSYGFRRRRGGFDVSVVPLADDLPAGALTDARSWYTLGGDFDVI